MLSLDSGELVYARDPDALLNPASNVKLFTSAAVLSRLGPEFRFETEFLTAPGPGGARTLYVRGKGDPTFVSERLWSAAGESTWSTPGMAARTRRGRGARGGT